MSTRSAIAIQHGDRIKAAYCHYDGYPAYNGRILNRFYNDSVAVNKLISMGDASGLGAEIGVKQDFDAKVTWVPIDGIEVASQCRFYGRDRGEDCSWLSFDSAKSFTDEYGNWGAEYFYLFKNNKWFVKARGGRWRLLSKVLANLKE